MSTAFTECVGCSRPIQLAGMGSVSTPALVAAVANAGGLGMFGAVGLDAAALGRALAEIRGLTAGAVGVNFLMPFLDVEAVDVAARAVRLVEFFYGEPDAELVRRAHAGGARVGWQVGSVGEARAAAAAGCDLVAAQGIEAGGHVRGSVPLSKLLPEIVAAVGVPVIAAGGVATRAQVVSALAAGASAARVGTRFVATRESGAHERYVSKLVSARAADTELTECFHVGWPDAPHRVLRSSIAAARATNAQIVGEAEIAGQRVPIPRFGVFPPTTSTTGEIEAMALYAGESVDAVHEVQGAAEIVAELAGSG